jgi:hypothetical protein
VGGREHDNFVVFVCDLQALFGQRADIETSLENLSRRKGDGESDISWLPRNRLPHAMSQGFIQIKDDTLPPAPEVFFVRQLDLPDLNIFLLDRLNSL